MIVSLEKGVGIESFESKSREEFGPSHFGLSIKRILTKRGE